MTVTLGNEEAFIQKYMAPLAADMPGAFGLGDDCAALTPLPGHDLIFKTDPITAGVHFFAEDPPADIAWKALAVNVSDLAAKGARPVAYLLALSCPQEPSEDWMRDFTAGLAAAQGAFGCSLIGGDTDRGPGPLTIAVTIIGETRTGCMVPRSGAQPGDVLYVSGTLGTSALGLALRNPSKELESVGLTESECLEAATRYLRPEPRLGLRAALRGWARSAMDISDGLIKDLDRMTRLSGTGATIALNQLPMASGVKRIRGANPALANTFISAGDDYEILAAVPPDAAKAFENAAERGAVPVSMIGNVTAERDVTVHAANGQSVSFQHGGYDHFRL